MRKSSAVWLPVIFAILIVISTLRVPPAAQAIPPFARKYKTSCTTCHDDFPHLNDFGKAFKDAGFKFPTDDETFLKVPPVLLGAPAQKELWPNTVWPGTIPGLPPIGLRYNQFFQVVDKNRGNYAYGEGLAAPTIPGFVPRTDFEPGLFSMFTAGNFGSDIAFWVDDDISVSGANANGALGDAYLRFVNIGRFLHLPKDSLHLRAGQFELELPFSQARSWNISPWDIYTQTATGALNSSFGQQNVVNGFSLDSAAQGVELSGGHHYAGYFWAVALVNQLTGSQSVDQSGLVPSATGSNSGGLGFFSDSNFKDVYARFAYRFNLERDADSRHAIQAAGPMGPRNHTFLRLGTLYYYGRGVQRFVGADANGNTVALTARQPFYRVGGDFEFNYRAFDFFGQYIYGRDHNLLPVDANGALIPLPLTVGAAPVPIGFVHSTPSTFSGGFLQADYMPVPWTMLILRYDGVNSWGDYVNGLESLPGNYFSPTHHTRNRITPGVQFLVHANIKASFEYQFRPEQQIAVGADPITGLPIMIRGFRTNTATAALEFVY